MISCVTTSTIMFSQRSSVFNLVAKMIVRLLQVRSQFIRIRIRSVYHSMECSIKIPIIKAEKNHFSGKPNHRQCVWDKEACMDQLLRKATFELSHTQLYICSCLLHTTHINYPKFRYYYYTRPSSHTHIYILPAKTLPCPMWFMHARIHKYTCTHIRTTTNETKPKTMCVLLETCSWFRKPNDTASPWQRHLQ